MSEAKEEEQQVLGDELPSYIHFPLAVRELASSKASCVRKLHKLFDSEIYQRLKSVEVSRVQIMREKSPWQLCNSKNGLWEKPKPPNLALSWTFTHLSSRTQWWLCMLCPYMEQPLLPELGKLLQ